MFWTYYALLLIQHEKEIIFWLLVYNVPKNPSTRRKFNCHEFNYPFTCFYFLHYFIPFSCITYTYKLQTLNIIFSLICISWHLTSPFIWYITIIVIILLRTQNGIWTLKILSLQFIGFPFFFVHCISLINIQYKLHLF